MNQVRKNNAEGLMKTLFPDKDLKYLLIGSWFLLTILMCMINECTRSYQWVLFSLTHIFTMCCVLLYLYRRATETNQRLASTLIEFSMAFCWSAIFIEGSLEAARIIQGPSKIIGFTLLLFLILIFLWAFLLFKRKQPIA